MNNSRRGNFGSFPRRPMRNYNDFGNNQMTPRRNNMNGGMRRRNFGNEMQPLRNRRPRNQFVRRRNFDNNRNDFAIGALRSRRRVFRNNNYNNDGNNLKPLRRIRMRNNNQQNNNNQQPKLRRGNRSKNSSINPNHAKTLYLFNLSPDSTIQDIKSTFGIYGRLTRCAIHYDKESGKSECTGVVRFTKESNKQSALNDLQSKIKYQLRYLFKWIQYKYKDLQSSGPREKRNERTK